MRRLGLLALLLALGPPLTAAEAVTRSEVKQKLDNTRQNKKQLEQKIKQGRQTVQKHVRAEKDILGQLYGINRELEAAQRDKRVHVKNLSVVEDRLSDLKRRQAQASAQEALDRAALRSQLRAVQRARARQGAALLFSARTPAQWSARANALGELSEGTGRKVQGLRRRLEQLESFRQDYAQRETELSRRRVEAETARQKALREASRRQAALKEVRQKKAQAQGAVAALEASANRLQGLMDLLQQQAQRLAQSAAPKGGGTKVVRTSSGPSTLRRSAPWPVAGRLLSRFGKQRHPVFNVNVYNRGIEIAAPYGATVKSVAAGTVEHVGEMPDFGRLVVVDHGGGMKSVYGYGSQALVSAGQKVAQGDPLVEVGEHGTAGQPALYFQISQNARPQDPLRYLSRR